MRKNVFLRIGTESSAIATIAYRDFTKLLRDRFRLVGSLAFPVMFVGILGGSLSASIGKGAGFDFLAFVFVGVFAQSLFQSSAAGVISLIQDRENDFSQELFVAPVSRYSIIFGKIFGETLVAFASGLGVIIFGFIIGVPLGFYQLILMILAGIAACLLGGAFGIFVLSNVSSQRTVAQIFPFILFPQVFLSGVFNPVDQLPLVLTILSRITPLTYAVDLVRHAYFGSVGERTVAFHPAVDLVVMGALFFFFLVIGTILFIRKERNR